MEHVPADQTTAEFATCFVNVGATFKANPSTTKMVQPTMRTFDDSLSFAPLARRFARGKCNAAIANVPR